VSDNALLLMGDAPADRYLALQPDGSGLVVFDSTTGAGAECCCGGGEVLFRRIEECCNTGLFIWVPEAERAALKCFTIGFMAKCWFGALGPVLTEAEILAQYPDESIVYTLAGAFCTSGCQDPRCPSCYPPIDPCCFTNEPAIPCCHGDLVFGREFAYSWTITTFGEYKRTSFLAPTLMQFSTYAAVQGMARYRTRETFPGSGTCVTELVSYTIGGTVRRRCEDANGNTVYIDGTIGPGIAPWPDCLPLMGDQEHWGTVDLGVGGYGAYFGLRFVSGPNGECPQAGPDSCNCAWSTDGRDANGSGPTQDFVGMSSFGRNRWYGTTEFVTTLTGVSGNDTVVETETHRDTFSARITNLAMCHKPGIDVGPPPGGSAPGGLLPTEPSPQQVRQNIMARFGVRRV
jgi:hypothetical protein